MALRELNRSITRRLTADAQATQMTFDSAIGILALSVGLAAVVLGLVVQQTPHRHKWIAAILTVCGTTLVTSIIYFCIVYLLHKEQRDHIEEAILQIIQSQPLTLDQIRDGVNLVENNATNQQILDAIEDLKYRHMVIPHRKDWTDSITDTKYYVTVYSTL